MNGVVHPTGESAVYPTLDPSYAEVFQRLLESRKSNSPSLGMLGVSSPVRGVGVSTVAANLAIIAAKTRRKRVLLVDANQRCPVQARKFRLASSPGLEDAFSGSFPIEQCLKRTPVPNLHLLPAEETVAANTEPSPKISEAVELFARVFDFVLVDLPIITAQAKPNADIAAILPQLNGVVLIVEPGSVTRSEVRGASAMVQHHHGNVLGVVLNNTK